MLSGFLFPLSPVRAETWWLNVVGRNGGKNNVGSTSAAWVIPTANEIECESGGLKITSDHNIHGKVYEHIRYTCIKGK